MDMMASGAAFVVGLVLMFTQGLPLLRAQKTGLLISKGINRDKVDRAVDPDRFKRLFKQRRGRLIGPILLLVIGGGYFSLCIFSLLLVARAL